MILAVIGLVGFTIATNENVSGVNLAVNEEFATIPVITSKISPQIEYRKLGTMRASWYGPRFHGRLTANGEIYDQTALTVAHKSLKFGTLLRITNPRTNKSIVVRVNDRGPYIPGRQLDLSKAAAEELGVISGGVKKLKVEEIYVKGMENPILFAN
ncbi:MAG: septal ring lytic transglycosylase RlpA family protein [Ignavibacteria bacterium]|jgi:rare lipoprotein A